MYKVGCPVFLKGKLGVCFDVRTAAITVVMGQLEMEKPLRMWRQQRLLGWQPQCFQRTVEWKQELHATEAATSRKYKLHRTATRGGKKK